LGKPLVPGLEVTLFKDSVRSCVQPPDPVRVRVKKPGAHGHAEAVGRTGKV